MSLVRLGDRLDSATGGTRRSYLRSADNLAQRIFDPELSGTRIAGFYIQSSGCSSPASDVTGQSDSLFSGLGEYERTILGKLVHPEKKVLCIVGPLGSGKTTTIRYLIDRLMHSPHHVVGGGPLCGNRRLITLIDFNTERFFAVRDEEEASRLLLNELCSKMRARLKAVGVPPEAEELSQFWQEEIERIREGDSCSQAFCRIVEQLREESLQLTGTLPQPEVEQRRRLLGKIFRDKEAYLDYLVRLWGYVTRKYYDGHYECTFIVFDNIDRASPAIQDRLVHDLITCAQDPGPLFVVLVRPETFERRGLGHVGARVIDVEDHNGPTPRDVLLDRLSRFLAAPRSYYIENEGLTLEQFEQLRGFLSRVYVMIAETEQRSNPFFLFLNHACGHSLRIALVLAHSFLRFSERDMGDPELSVYHLIRACICGGDQGYRASIHAPIGNLFHVSGEEKGRLLIKPRILRYLFASPEKTRTLNEIACFCRGFDYPVGSLVRKALNEMMNIYCQMVRSNGFDSYEDAEDMQHGGNNSIRLTDIGSGYIEYLIYSLDYVQEVMLDCYVPPRDFPVGIPYGYLPEKLLLLHTFLRILLEADEEETLQFLRRYGKLAYREVFGKQLLTFPIVKALTEQVTRIIRSLQQRAASQFRQYPAPWLSYDEVLQRFESLLNFAAKKNHDVLGIWPQEA